MLPIVNHLFGVGGRAVELELMFLRSRTNYFRMKLKCMKRIVFSLYCSYIHLPSSVVAVANYLEEVCKCLEPVVCVLEYGPFVELERSDLLLNVDFDRRCHRTEHCFAINSYCSCRYRSG